MNLEKLLNEILTTHDVSEGNGVGGVNLADGMLAIADGLHHIAHAIENHAAVKVTVMPDGMRVEPMEPGGHA